MTTNAPGKHYRKGISLIQALRKFGDDEKAEAWLVAQRWPDGIRCTACDSDNRSERPPRPSRKTKQYHCTAARAISRSRLAPSCMTPSSH